MADESDYEDPDPSPCAPGDGLDGEEEALQPVVPNVEVREDELPKTLVSRPVLEPGEPLRMREKTRSRLAMLLAGLVGIVLLALVGATFRLSPTETVEQLKDLQSILLPVLVGTLVAYYFPKQP